MLALHFSFYPASPRSRLDVLPSFRVPLRRLAALPSPRSESSRSAGKTTLPGAEVGWLVGGWKGFEEKEREKICLRMLERKKICLKMSFGFC